MDQGILNGIRVLDFTRVLAGPYATRIFGDFGAEIIKVQSGKASNGIEANTGTYFSTWNRNKLSIALDMGFPEARDVALKLAGISDVVIENFSPRVMLNWDIGYDKIKEVKEDIIMISMSAMGQSGPWRDVTAFAPAIQSISGLTFLTSHDSHNPEGPGYSYSDTIAGLYAVVAVLAALDYRDRTSQGQYIDLSEYEAACTLLGPAFLESSLNKKEILPQGNRSDDVPAAPYGCYKCRGEDRWCVIAVFSEKEWNGLLSVMEYPEWSHEENFTTLEKRKSNEDALNRLIEEWTVNYSSEEVVEKLQKAHIHAAVVQNADDIANDPHLAARNYFMEIEHPVSGSIITDNSPIRFVNSPGISRKASPRFGQDNYYVYGELLGMQEKEIQNYISKGVFA